MTGELAPLREIADRLMSAWLKVDPASWPHTQFVYAGLMIVTTLIVFTFALNFAGLFIFFERRIAARMQSRVGPNRVGPNGVIQWAADGIKCLFKEDLIPADSDKKLFRLAPYFVVTGMVLSFAAMPFSSALIATDLDVGILFVLGVTSLVVIGLLMGGWGSNSKWALLGGMRSAAQVVSYEIPAGIAAMSVIAMAGSLSMQDLIKAQSGAPWGWAIFASPFTIVAFFIFFIAQLAEGSRTPFDLPEAESELVSGYNTEYSGMRFLMFFLGEFANIWVLCAVSVALFLGGWQIPFGEQGLDGRYPHWVTHDVTTAILFTALIISGGVPLLLVARALSRVRASARVRIEDAAIPPLGRAFAGALGASAGFIAGCVGASFVGMPLRSAALGGVVLGSVVGIFTAMTLGRSRLAFRAILKATFDGIIVVAVGLGLGLLLLSVFQWTGWFASSFQTIAGIPWADVRRPVAINGTQLALFVTKTLILVFIVIQLRWTLPRVRVDQMMSMCWKYLVPLSMAALIGTMFWELLVHGFGPLGIIMRVLMTGLSLWVLYRYIVKIRRAYQVDKKNFEAWRGESPWYPPWKLV